jgi:beta-glucosidase
MKAASDVCLQALDAAFLMRRESYMQNTELLLKKLTLEEKCALLSGAETFKTRGMPEHGIPQIWLSDGPHGLRKQAGESDHLGLNPSVPATCFPTASAIANSWDTALGEEIGAALGEEAAAQEVSVVLGPGLNMKRNPLCGRSFEYFSEDPYLAGKLAAGYIRGIQSKGVAACPKHFAVNSQETRRMASDSIVDERTLREIYLTGFEIAVKEGHPRSIMSSYNLVNGTYANENKHLLMEILRGEWGFDGAVITDWGGSNDHALGVKNGSTLEMPAPGGDSVRELLAAVESGKISESDIDARLSELLPLVFDTKAALDAAPREFDAAAHHALARRAAEESLVLLKNEGALLPLAAGTKVAVIGDFAKNPRYQGAGSSMVNSTQVDVLLDKLIDSELNVIGYQQGFDRHGKPDAALQKSACELATQADTVILCMGLDEIAESEGLDRSNLRLAQNQLDLLQAVAAVNPKIVVVLYSGSVVETPWLDNCQALLYAALGGQAGAGAVADALTGKVNPCGKLAETWPLAYADVPSAADFATRRKTVEYREGLYIGYRYFTTAEKAVRFPFGYGMSYTTFAYSDMAADEQGVSLTVTNTGSVAGTEIVQLYTAKKNSELFRPAKELKGFARVTLAPGEKQRITIMLDDKAFRFWNVKANRWEIEGGEYELLVGASVEDIRLCEKISVHGTATVHPYEDRNLDCYYKGNVLHVSDADFEKLLGHPIPNGKTKIDRNLTLGELNHARSPLGWLVWLVLTILLDASYKRGKPDLNILFQYNMPLRALAKMTNGAISMGMVDGIVMELQGFWILGLVRVIYEAIKNVVLNAQMEKRLRGA